MFATCSGLRFIPQMTNALNLERVGDPCGNILLSAEKIQSEFICKAIDVDTVWLHEITSEINRAFVHLIAFPCTSWTVDSQFKRIIYFWRTALIEIIPFSDDAWNRQEESCFKRFLNFEECYQVTARIGDLSTMIICQEHDLAQTVIRLIDIPTTIHLWAVELLNTLETMRRSQVRYLQIIEILTTILENRAAVYVTQDYVTNIIYSSLFSNPVTEAVGMIVPSNNSLSLARNSTTMNVLSDFAPDDLLLIPFWSVLARGMREGNIASLKNKLGLSERMIYRLNHLSRSAIAMIARSCPTTEWECALYVEAVDKILITGYQHWREGWRNRSKQQNTSILDTTFNYSLISPSRSRCANRSTHQKFMPNKVRGHINLDPELPRALRVIARIELHRRKGEIFLDAAYVSSLCNRIADNLPLAPAYPTTLAAKVEISIEQIVVLLEIYLLALVYESSIANLVPIGAAVDWMIATGAVLDKNQLRRGWLYVANRVCNWQLAETRFEKSRQPPNIHGWFCKLRWLPKSVWWPQIVGDSPYGIRPLTTLNHLFEESITLNNRALDQAILCMIGLSRLFSVYDLLTLRRIATIQLIDHNYFFVKGGARDPTQPIYIQILGSQETDSPQENDLSRNPIRELAQRLADWYSDAMATANTIYPK